MFGPIERVLYRFGGIDAGRDQSWRGYAAAMLVVNITGIVLLYSLQRLQGVLPLNPQGFAGVDPSLAFNTAISFVINTNWQSYGGESAMSHLVQMAGLTVQNFLSAATGVALAFEFIRCFERRDAEGIGSFWADITRVTLHPAARLHCLCAGSCGSRRAANARGFGRRDDAGRRAPDHRARPRREPGSDQDVRGPMAAASSTPTAPVRSRTLRRLQTLSR